MVSDYMLIKSCLIFLFGIHYLTWNEGYNRMELRNDYYIVGNQTGINKGLIEYKQE